MTTPAFSVLESRRRNLTSIKSKSENRDLKRKWRGAHMGGTNHLNREMVFILCCNKLVHVKY